MNTSTLACGVLAHTDTFLPGPDPKCICRKRPHFGNFAGWVQVFKSLVKVPKGHPGYVVFNTLDGGCV